MPLVDSVWDLIHGGVGIESISAQLMGRAPNTEFYGMDYS